MSFDGPEEIPAVRRVEGGRETGGRGSDRHVLAAQGPAQLPARDGTPGGGVHPREALSGPAQAVGRAQDQHPGRRERALEGPDHPFDRVSAEVDQHVAAGDQVELTRSRRRVAHEVVAIEPHQPPEHRARHDSRGRGVEVPRPCGGVESLQRTAAGDTRSCLGERGRGDVGTDDRHWRLRGPEPAAGEQCERVGLLARGTCRHPDADCGGPRRPRTAQQRRPVDGVELLALAEEERLVDRDLVGQPIHQAPASGGGVRLQELAGAHCRLHARQRGLQRCHLRFPYPDARLAPDHVRHLGERAAHAGTGAAVSCRSAAAT